MAIATTTVTDVFEAVRHTLQDTEENRWTDTELFTYLNQGMRDVALRTKYKYEKDVITVSDSATTYNLNYEVIEFYKIDTEQTYEILTDQTIKFEDQEDEEVTVEYYAYPDKIAYAEDTDISISDELIYHIKNFILFKCYEKEDSTESLGKAQYFYQHYMDGLTQDMPKWHGAMHNDFAKNDFYI